MGGKASSQTIGYRYFMSVQMGLGRGPINELVAIKVADKVAWQGRADSTETIGIFKPDLFGGDDKEGGIVGALQLYMGAPTQTMDAPPALNADDSDTPYDTKLGLPVGPTSGGFWQQFMVVVKDALGGLVPGFRGVVTAWFDGLITSNNPYPKEWKFRVRRHGAGWFDDDCWYPAKVMIPMGDETGDGEIIPLGNYVEGAVAEEVAAEGSGIYYHGELVGPANWQNIECLQNDDPNPQNAGTISDGAFLASNSNFLSDYLYVRDFGLVYPEGVTPATIKVRVTWHSSTTVQDIGGEMWGTSYTVEHVGLAWGAAGANRSANAAAAPDPVFGSFPYGHHVITVAEYEFDVAELGLSLADIQSADFGVLIQVSRSGFFGSTFGVQKVEIFADYQGSSGEIHAMNPAHIILQSYTDPDWGGGMSMTKADLDSFTAAADTLYAERFGLCLTWFRQEEIEVFVQHVIDHIGAALYVDRGTGLLNLKLIRDDYDPDTLPLYTYDSGLLRIDEDDTAAPEGAYNEVVVKYHDPMTDEDRSVRAQSPAARLSAGATSSTTTSYPGIPTYELAARVALRDLRTHSSGLKRFKVRLDRRGWKLHPGSVFRISVPEKGIANMVLRAGKVDDGTLTDGAIEVMAIQDVFGLPSTSYVAKPTTGWTPPNTTPQPILSANGALLEVTYRDLARTITDADLATISEDQAFVSAVAATPGGSPTNFQLWDKAAGEAAYIRAGIGNFAPSGTIVAALGPYDTAVTVTGLSGFDDEVVGGAVLIDDEICRVDAFDYDAGTMTIARGCVDTIPAAHPSGARFYMIDDNRAVDSRAYADTEVISGKLLTQTATGLLPLASAPTLGLTLAARQGRPYPPGDVKVEGIPVLNAGTTAFDGDVEVTWTHRDRIIQDDQLVEHGAASVGPEAGVTYTIRVYDLDDDTTGTVVRTAAGIAGTSWTYTEVDRLADGWHHKARVELEAVRDGLASWKTYSFLITRSALTADTTEVTADSTINTADEG